MGVTELAMAIERMLRSNTRGRSMRFDTVRVGVIDVAHRRGRTRLSDIAAELDVNPSSVTRCVQELAEGGLVRLVENPEDGRSSYVELTGEGRGEWTRYREAGIGALGRVLQDWSEEDVLELTRLLGRLTDDWEAAPFHVVSSPLQRAPKKAGGLAPPPPRGRRDRAPASPSPPSSSEGSSQ
jgi:DNA-binding MarR family transcriptional regulator